MTLKTAKYVSPDDVNFLELNSGQPFVKETYVSSSKGLRQSQVEAWDRCECGMGNSVSAQLLSSIQISCHLDVTNARSSPVYLWSYEYSSTYYYSYLYTLCCYLLTVLYVQYVRSCEEQIFILCF